MFTPAVPLPGVAGWQLLKRTEAAQRAAFADAPQLKREVAAFRARIADVTTAQGLVADRTLLKVALGAFGLDAEIGKTAFLERILAEGTLDPGALANRFVDPRYAAFSAAFGFGDGLPLTGTSGFADRIVAAYEERQFEIGVGAADDAMRLALNFRREIADYAADATAGQPVQTQWLRVLGNRPMRTVFETAFGLPDAFAALPLEDQIATLRDRVRPVLGSDDLSGFAAADAVETVINRFLVRDQARGGGVAVAGSAALQLLQAGTGAGLKNLILSAVR